MPTFIVEYEFTSKFMREIKAPSIEAAQATVKRGITLKAEDLVDSTHTSTTLFDSEGLIVE